MGVSVPPPRYAGDGIAHVNASDGRPGCVNYRIIHPTSWSTQILISDPSILGLTDGWPSLDMAAAS